MASKTDVTVYIGRFTPFHLGHAHVLRQALNNSKLVIVLLGSAYLARSLKNPFTFIERRRIIESWVSAEIMAGTIPHDAEIHFAPLRDFTYNNALWIRNVQEKVKTIVRDVALRTNQILTDIRVTGSDRDESTWYLNAFPQWKKALVETFRHDGTGDLSATEVRELLFSGRAMEPGVAERLIAMLPRTTYEWLVKFADSPEHFRLARWYEQNRAYKEAWSVAPYAPIFTTVDAVIVQSGHILVVERGAEPGMGLWALPGGFLNTNERLRDGVVREVLEETGLRLADGKKAKEITEDILKNCIREQEVFDAPDRSMRGRTITHAFFIRLDDTKPLPKVKGQNAPLHETGGVAEVETAKAFWLPINEALSRSEMWFEDHHAIIETMIGGKDL
jgi:bifunctional NMN adenylyltransferase/nudix hydrolase